MRWWIVYVYDPFGLEDHKMASKKIVTLRKNFGIYLSLTIQICAFSTTHVVFFAMIFGGFSILD